MAARPECKCGSTRACETVRINLSANENVSMAEAASFVARRSQPTLLHSMATLIAVNADNGEGEEVVQEESMVTQKEGCTIPY